MRLIKILTMLSFAIFFLSCDKKKQAETHEHHGNPAESSTPSDTVRKSIPKEVHANVGSAHITIQYHAPAVRGRTIWGGLVPYGEVWVTGAHKATSLEINKTITMAGKEIPAGKYALFTIPGQQNWTVIINKNWDQHLADDYNEKEDILRFEVTPEQTEKLQERLQYSVVELNERQGSVTIRWEKLRISIPFFLD